MVTFNERLEIGKSGETIVAEFLRGRGISVEDVTDQREYQIKDIDFKLTNQEGQKCTLEVKTDYLLNKTGNLFFEGVYYKEFGESKGWNDYCEADYIAFLDAIGMKLYIYDYRNGKECITKKGELKYFFNNDDGCYREAYLLPLHEAKRANLLQKFDLCA